MIRRLIAWGFVCALVFAGTAQAGVEIRGVDASAYPTLRATVVTDGRSDIAPQLFEGNRAAAGATAQNLGRSKSVVIAIDRSQSMAGQALEDAVAAAGAFVRAKPSTDRISSVAFGEE